MTHKLLPTTSRLALTLAIWGGITPLSNADCTGDASDQIVNCMNGECPHTPHTSGQPSGSHDYRQKLPPESVARLKGLGSHGWPALSKDTTDILSDTPPTQKLTIRVDRGDHRPTTEQMSPNDILAYSLNQPETKYQVIGIPIQRTLDFAPVANKFENHWHEKWSIEMQETPLTKMVRLKSGEVVEFVGNKERFLELAKDPSVAQILDAEPPNWMKSFFNVHPKDRLNSKHFIDEMTKQLGSKVTYNSAESHSDLPGMTVYHGTLDVFESSIKKGPKNVGAGFGGGGLYLAVKGERSLANQYAHFAFSAVVSEKSGSTSHLAAPNHSTQTAKPIVMIGRINPEGNYRVGRFRVNRDIIKPDLKKGELPSNWSSDPNLNKFIEETFDILEITDMQSGGLAIDSDRVLIVHERAGKDAIVWEKTEPAQ